MTNFQDDSRSGSKRSGKALTKALRRLPTGGWDSRYSRQSLSALFLAPTSANVSPAVHDQPATRSTNQRKAAKFTELAIALPDVRARRIAELKAQINSGNYDVTGLDIANKMLGD